MYLELLESIWKIQKHLYEVVEATEHDAGISLFALSHQLTSIEFLKRTKPPDGCDTLRDFCLNAQRLGARLMAHDVDSIPAPDDLVREYERAIDEFGDALAKLPGAHGETRLPAI